MTAFENIPESQLELDRLELGNRVATWFVISRTDNFLRTRPLVEVGYLLGSFLGFRELLRLFGGAER